VSERLGFVRSDRGASDNGVAPAVTIGLPVYNGGELVARAIESVLAQTCGDLELVISDNCSTDSTPEVCKAYARRDPRVVYRKTDRNVGAAANHSRLVHLARGKYFKWISHDDWMEPGFIEACLPVGEANPDAITVAPIVDVVDPRGKKLQSVTSYTGRSGWSERRLDQFREMMDELTYCDTHADGLLMIAYLYGMHRTGLLRRTRLLMPFISSDHVLAAELSLFGRLVEIDRPLSSFTLGTSQHGTTANFTAWNPAAIQRQLSGTHPGRLQLFFSVRRRHAEYVAAVLRSPLPARDKVLAALAATRPARARLASRATWNRNNRASRLRESGAK